MQYGILIDTWPDPILTHLDKLEWIAPYVETIEGYGHKATVVVLDQPCMVCGDAVDEWVPDGDPALHDGACTNVYLDERNADL